MVTEDTKRDLVAEPTVGASLAAQLVCLVGALVVWFARLPLIDA